ncbi:MULTISPECIES: hypothetical protein [Tepidanaerobacter]|uniref:hypothetical protein n=1 Tax=Tepidanaerobacter TaxID=499228 RepID=UPI001BD3CD7D|nr:MULTISPECIES: hypothetical protein [Tepidanaerobacter]
MAYAPYVVRVIARAIITKYEMGIRKPAELVLVYPADERQPILDEVYNMRPDLRP